MRSLVGGGGGGGGGGGLPARARGRGVVSCSSTLTQTKSERVEKNLRRVGVYCNGCSRILERLL